MQDTTTETFPVDWAEWQDQWFAWLSGSALNSVRNPLPGRNFLADEVLGAFKTPNGRTVELSAVTMPNLSERDPATGRLLETRHRYIGFTFADGENGLVESFPQLEQVLSQDAP